MVRIVEEDRDERSLRGQQWPKALCIHDCSHSRGAGDTDNRYTDVRPSGDGWSRAERNWHEGPSAQSPGSGRAQLSVDAHSARAL
jgi:hypothetical protein